MEHRSTNKTRKFLQRLLFPFFMTLRIRFLVLGVVTFTLSSLGFSKISILCVGDSITCGKSTPDVPGGYRVTLETMLAGKSMEFEFLGARTENSDGMSNPCHEGWPGYRIEQIAAAALPTFCAASADVVLVLAGTNDVRQGFALNQAPARLEVLITLAAKLQPRARVIVASLPLLLYDDKRPHQVSARRAYNMAVPDVVGRCRQRGLNVEYLDMASVLNESDIASDTVHPNASGYGKIGRAWFNIICVNSNGSSN
jgi:lysophospholipase L1-like esterase